MADIASSDVTITVQSGTHRIQNKVREITVLIAFGNGTLTYPTGGVPLPGYASFGMQRYLEDIVIVDNDCPQGIMWKYDRPNKKLRAYIPALDVGAAGAATVDDFPFDTTGEPLATAVSISLTNSTGAGIKYLGRQQELVNTQAPAAAAIYAVARGW